MDSGQRVSEQHKVLVVDDEPSIQKLIAHHLERAGFAVELIADGGKAFERLTTGMDTPDLVLLDVMLPGMDGMEICRRIRQLGIHVPIIMLTARDDEIDRVVGLEIGADDYVTKPFSPRELVARIRAVMRRIEAPQTTTHVSMNRGEVLGGVIVAGNITLDVRKHEVTLAGEPITLTPKEFELLHYFMEHPDWVHSRDALLDQLWGHSSVTDTRMVDVHVSHLRDKIEYDPKSPSYIHTVRGVGYKFTANQGR